MYHSIVTFIQILCKQNNVMIELFYSFSQAMVFLVKSWILDWKWVNQRYKKRILFSANRKCWQTWDSPLFSSWIIFLDKNCCINNVWQLLFLLADDNENLGQQWKVFLLFSERFYICIRENILDWRRI